MQDLGADGEVDVKLSSDILALGADHLLEVDE